MQRWRVAAGLGVSILAGVVALVLLGSDGDDAPVAAGSPATAGGTEPDDDEGAVPTTREEEIVVQSDEPSEHPAHTGAHVVPADVGDSVGAIDPQGVIDGDVAVVTDHRLLADVTINGCVTIDADHVTLRNVAINCDHTYPIKDTATTGTRLERVTIDCLDDPRTRKAVFFEFSTDFGVDRAHIRRCDDQFFVDGGVGESWITNSVFGEQQPATDAHTDGVQIGTFETTTGSLVIEGNWWEYERTGCCENAVVFASSQSALEVVIRSNHIDDDFGTHLIRCAGEARCVVEDNTIGAAPESLVVHHPSPERGLARCNRYADGRLVPEELFDGIDVDNRDC